MVEYLVACLVLKWVALRVESKALMSVDMWGGEMVALKVDVKEYRKEY
jgi:hypothetical protein